METSAAPATVPPEPARTKYSEIVVGTEFATVEWSVTEAQISLNCEASEEYHEWYSLGSPWGSRVAPPLMNYRPARDRFSSLFKVRGLLYQYDMENFNPIRPDTKMIVSGKVTDKWIKKGKAFVAYEVSCVDKAGLPIFRTRRVHLLDSSD